VVTVVFVAEHPGQHHSLEVDATARNTFVNGIGNVEVRTAPPVFIPHCLDTDCNNIRRPIAAT
uniref:hypothetical protein n=1 Tax=Phascolarctobacterium faecium TaxID=33025 RepID=UPI003AAFEFE2